MGLSNLYSQDPAKDEPSGEERVRELLAAPVLEATAEPIREPLERIALAVEQMADLMKDQAQTARNAAYVSASLARRTLEVTADGDEDLDELIESMKKLEAIYQK